MRVYSALEAAIPGLTTPITMDQKTLEATPGYQFNLDQGIRGVNLSGVGSGLSGAQAKAAARYARRLGNDAGVPKIFNSVGTESIHASLSYVTRRGDLHAR